MKFSVIIPMFNPDVFDLTRCIESARHQDAEILLIDDHSTNWAENIQLFGGVDVAEDTPLLLRFNNIDVLRTEKQSGPGAARNVGLDKACGDWIIFLDSDDYLDPEALNRLSDFIKRNPDVDAIGYGWAYTHDKEQRNQRQDGECLNWAKHELLAEYLKLRMDGSVIYTAVKRSLIEKHEMRFRHGLHEDIDFIFNVYRNADKPAYLPEVLYHKANRLGAITSTVSAAHISGFFAGWQVVMGLVVNMSSAAYELGVIGVVATRIREVCYKATNPALFTQLHALIPKHWKTLIMESECNTMYAQAAKQFLLNDGRFDPSIFRKKWSCNDLQHSLFLAPAEVRTCCKRFYRGNELTMRGDVVLVTDEHINATDILNAKHALIDAINKGDETSCTGCPFLEFKEWPESTGIQYLSMEQHTVCNMKCTYCDETYYGGQRPQYDVLALLPTLPLEGLRTVVWGGGEPTLGKRFHELLAWLMENTRANHRFLTNATVYSKAIERVMRSGRGEVVTSIDAGTPETFATVRGTRLGLRRVLANVRNYARVNASVVTIKYILTADNYKTGDLLGFALLVTSYKLEHCNFQISCDFQDERISNEMVRSASFLKRQLHAIGCHVVFFDDLLMQRLPKDAVWVERADSYPEGVVVFGTGAMTEWMLTNTAFLRDVRIIARNEYVRDAFVLVTGSQSYPANYRAALAAGVSECMIIQGVVV